MIAQVKGKTPMTDLENVETLRAIVQLLKTQMLYVRNLHEALGVMYDALKTDHPELEANQKAEMEKIRVNAPQQVQIHEADELLLQLAKLG
jgi:hypothetical protein